MILAREFYARPTLDVLREMIGKVLVHEGGGRAAAGIIVEAEAYIGESDPACHAAPGPTRRNRPLYGPPGRAYVYLNYGIHNLMNAVTEEEGFPAAILIRALEPVEGLPLMRRRRGSAVPEVSLCRGPGNLTVALGITLRHNRAVLTDGGALRIEDRGVRPPSLTWSPRIGIRVGTDRLWRCSWEGNQAVSGRSNGRRSTDHGAVRPSLRADHGGRP
jgi:DNA-3-methyladenine glycosylase